MKNKERAKGGEREKLREISNAKREGNERERERGDGMGIIESIRLRSNEKVGRGRKGRRERETRGIRREI